METQTAQTISRRQNSGSPVGVDDGNSQRLNKILAANAEIALEKATFQNYREEFEASLMKKPLTTAKAFSYFGLLLGTFPPAAIFFKLLGPNSEPGAVILLAFVNLMCAVGGYFSGKTIGKMIFNVERYSWTRMLLTLPFIGMLWGIMAGGAGGVFIFIVGAFAGAFFAAIIGSLAIPAFTIFHRLLKQGEMIEQNDFLPLAFGISLTISALILGL